MRARVAGMRDRIGSNELENVLSSSLLVEVAVVRRSGPDRAAKRPNSVVGRAKVQKSAAVNKKRVCRKYEVDLRAFWIG